MQQLRQLLLKYLSEIVTFYMYSVQPDFTFRQGVFEGEPILNVVSKFVHYNKITSSPYFRVCF